MTDDIAQGYNSTGINMDYQKGYRVFTNSEASFKKIIPKFEYVKGYNALGVEKVQQVQYNYVEISESNMSLFGQTCFPDINNVDEYVHDLGLLSAYQVTGAKDIISFAAPGVCTEDFTIENGLTSLSVNITDKGAFTTYEFTDTYLQPPSQGVLESSIKNRLDPDVSHLNGLISVGGSNDSSNRAILDRGDLQVGQNLRANLYKPFP
jgi:hypothetical protein